MPLPAPGSPPLLVRHAPDGSIHLTEERGHLVLAAIAPDTIRVVMTRRDPAAVRPLLVTLPPPSPVPTQLRIEADAWWWSTTALSVRIDAVTLALDWFTADGTHIVREPRRGGRKLHDIPVTVHRVAEESAEIQRIDSPDGSKMLAAGTVACEDRHAYRVAWTLELSAAEALYGLGSHEDGRLDYRGRSQELYHHNLKVPVPVLVSSRGWGLLLDTGSYTHVEDGPAGLRLTLACEDALDAWFIQGPSLDGIVRRVHQLTGRPSRLPKWAFGYVQSKERYHTQAEVLDVAREFRRRDIPLDLIVQDWKTWTGDFWGQKSPDPARFGDVPGLIRDLQAEGVRLMWSIWPNMANQGPDQRAFAAAGLLCANRSTYDATRLEARTLYATQLEAGLGHLGIDAWWTDCTEPFGVDWQDECALDRGTRASANVAEFARMLDPEHLNLYPLRHAETIALHQSLHRPHRRLLNLTRATCLGSQKYGAVFWSGDISARWDVYRGQIAEALNYCATGLPWWTCDVGGFFTGTRACSRRFLENPAAVPLWFWDGDFERGVADPAYRELYLRWLQFALFLPMMRSHGTDTPREPWQFGEAGTPIYDGILAAIRLRTRLVPYLYSLARAVVEDGYTLLRLLAFDFPHDPRVLRIDDQFMCGPALLVCPVTHPLVDAPHGQRLSLPLEREVYLPVGRDWFDLWTGEVHSGGQFLRAPAPLDRCPVFVPAGSILPLGPVRAHVAAAPQAPLEIHIYPGRDGIFHFHDDAGDGHGADTGAREDWTILWHDATRTLELTARLGRWPGMAETRRLRFVVVGPARGLAAAPFAPALEITWDGRPVAKALPVAPLAASRSAPDVAGWVNGKQ